MQKDSFKETKPWWQFGHVWLVISGPAIVVVAGFITLYLAISSPNEIVTDSAYLTRIETSKMLGENLMNGSDSPAVQARNHAATGVVPVPR